MLRLVTPKKPSERLHEAIAAIAAGEVSEKARACGQSRAYFGRIRMKPVDVGIDTFAEICAGLGRRADDLMGLKPPDPLVPEVERLKAALAEALAANARYRKALTALGTLPPVSPEGEAPVPRRPTSRKE